MTSNIVTCVMQAIYVAVTHADIYTINRVNGHKQQSSAIAKHYNMLGTIPQDELQSSCPKVISP